MANYVLGIPPQATCAGCESPISRGEKFVLAGTEVFHRLCAEAGAIENSVLTRTRKKIVQLTKHVANAAANADRAIRNTEAAMESCRTYEKALRRTEELRDAATLESRNRQEGDRQLLVEARQRIMQLEQQLRESQRGGERATTSFMSARQSGATTTDSAAVLPPTEVAKDDRDDSEIRFSLLEIDPS